MRRLSGWGALAATAVALNLMVWLQQPFSLLVLGPLAVALGFGALWLLGVSTAAARRSLNEGRTVGGINAVLSSLVFLGIVIVLYAFFQRWDKSWDLTKEGRRQLAPQTVQLLQNLTNDVNVTCFFLNNDDELVVIARDKTLRFLEQCQKLSEHIKVELLDPQIDRTRLEAMEITHASRQGTIVIRQGDRKRVVTLSGASPRLEEREFANALINVVRQNVAKVYFLAGHHERDMKSQDERTGGSMFANLLAGEAYKVEDLQVQLSAPEVPMDCDILVLNNPALDLHPQEKEAIQAYLDRGGRLLLLIDPWRSVQTGSLGREVMRPWLEEKFGIEVGSDIVVNDQQKNKWLCELHSDDKPFEGTDQGFGEYRGAFNVSHPITRAFDQAMLLQANRTVGLKEKLPEKMTGGVLLRSAPGFWAESDVSKLAETGEAVRNEDEKKGPLPLAAAVAALTAFDPEHTGRGREARIVVVGDSDFASNGQLVVPGNLNFLLNSIAWLGEHEELIAIRATGKAAQPLILTDTQRRSVAWIAILLPTQCVAAAGLIVLGLRRKNR